MAKTSITTAAKKPARRVNPPVQRVQTRLLAPPPPALPEDPAAVLWRPTPQLDAPTGMRVSWPVVTPAKAEEFLRISENNPDFRQRPTRLRDVRRWKLLMETDRFVQWLPDGPLCFDEEGCLLNGKHRLTALAGQDKAFGLMVVRGVPRWMFPFFDTGRGRTLNDVFAIAGRMSKAQTGSTMRLAMRYEEFLRAARPPIGWIEWAGHRDEHSDVDLFLDRVGDLADLYETADRNYRGSKIIISSLMVFRHYQRLAWPEGEPELLKFWEGLGEGAMLASKSPALMLREWARKVALTRERIRAKRELHLLLLFRYFALHVQGSRVDEFRWAHGFPMTMPYHPGGPEQAVKNCLAAVDESITEWTRHLP